MNVSSPGPDPVLYDTHMHTPLCKHADGEPEDYAAVAQARGLKGIIVTCHNPVPDWAPNIRMELDEFDDYVALVARAREAWAGRLDVLLGLESDYVPGMEEWLEVLHTRAPLNYVLGSVHPQLKPYKARFYNGDNREYALTYFKHLAMAAETGLFDCLSHPDLVKNIVAHDWEPMNILDDVRPFLDRIAATGIAMEINTSGLHKVIREMNPGPIFLKEMCERQIPVVIGSDAHVPERVGADFEQALDNLEAAGYRSTLVFAERRAREIPISLSRETLCSFQ